LAQAILAQVVAQGSKMACVTRGCYASLYAMRTRFSRGGLGGSWARLRRSPATCPSRGCGGGLALPPCRLVIFDKDGTLLDDAKTWAPVIEQLAAATAPFVPSSRLFEVLGYDAGKRHFTADSLFMTATNEEVVERIRADVSAAAADAVDRFIAELPPHNAVGVPLVPLRPMMLELRSVGAQVAVLTSDNRRFAEAFLQANDVLDLVSASVCGDDGLAPKPSAAPVLALCERTGVPPQEAAMVGDSAERDVGCGLAAGVGSAVGVTSGVSSAEELKRAGAHLVVPTVASVLGALRGRHTLADP